MVDIILDILEFCVFSGELFTVISIFHKIFRFIRFFMNSRACCPIWQFDRINLIFLFLLISSFRETDKSTFERCETEMVPVKCIAVLQFVLIWMYVLGPLYELFMAPDAHNKPFPYRMKFPYDANHGLKYVFTYTLTSVAGMGVVYTLLSEDTLFAFFMTYTCGQFRLLHKSIDNIICKGQELANKRYPDDDKDSLVHNARIQREYRELLIKIIKHHNVVIQ